MGVPVVTAKGALPASRSAASVLDALGLAEWSASDLAGFEACALARAADIGAIAGLRRTLRARLRASALMDEAGFVAAFEAALERAWRERTAA
jgi:protein O-GlcNAc transferase